jgi:hypothetical protein
MVRLILGSLTCLFHVKWDGIDEMDFVTLESKPRRVNTRPSSDIEDRNWSIGQIPA